MAQDKAVAEALKPRNTDTDKNVAFLQIILQTWLISCKNAAEEEMSMLKAECEACSHSIAVGSVITSGIGDGILAPSNKAVSHAAFAHWSMRHATMVMLELESLVFISVET